MENMDGTDENRSDPAGDQEIRILCKVDVNGHELEVDWTNGAIFHFSSDRQVDLWIQTQNSNVPGTLHLKTDSPGDGQLDPDYYLYYRPQRTEGE